MTNEIKNFKAIYCDDLYFVSEYWYKRENHNEEFDRDYEKEDGTSVFWKGHNQIYQSKFPVKIFKLYLDDEFIDC